jgi:hypothetical protein
MPASQESPEVLAQRYSSTAFTINGIRAAFQTGPPPIRESDFRIVAGPYWGVEKPGES